MAPDGNDVEVTKAGAEEDDSDEASSPGLTCHFHAGVEYVLRSIMAVPR